MLAVAARRGAYREQIILRVVAKENFGTEPRLEIAADRRPGKVMDAGDDAVCG
jgi:hypothetical protein